MARGQRTVARTNRASNGNTSITSKSPSLLSFLQYKKSVPSLDTKKAVSGVAQVQAAAGLTPQASSHKEEETPLKHSIENDIINSPLIRKRKPSSPVSSQSKTPLKAKRLDDLFAVQLRSADEFIPFVPEAQTQEVEWTHGQNSPAIHLPTVKAPSEERLDNGSSTNSLPVAAPQAVVEKTEEDILAELPPLDDDLDDEPVTAAASTRLFINRELFSPSAAGSLSSYKFSPLPKFCTKPSLAIPESLAFFEKLVFALDTVILFNESRGLSPIFLTRIQKPAESMLSRTITPETINDLVGLFPSAYQLEPWTGHHLGKTVKSFIISMKHHDPQFTNFNQDELYCRRSACKKLCLEFVFKRHLDWCKLNGHNSPSNISDLHSWHPKFPLAEVALREVVNVDCCPLPEAVSMKEGVIGRELVEEVPKEKSMSSLLERLRAKEKAKNENIMKGCTSSGAALVTNLQDPYLEAQLLPMVDSIYFFFATMKRNVCLLGDLSRKLAASMKVSMSQETVILILKELVRLLPQFLTFVASEGCSTDVSVATDDVLYTGTFIKCDRTLPLKKLKDELQSKLCKKAS